MIFVYSLRPSDFRDHPSAEAAKSAEVKARIEANRARALKIRDEKARVLAAQAISRAAKAPKAPSIDYTFDFGKYNGESLLTIWKRDKKYIVNFLVARKSDGSAHFGHFDTYLRTKEMGQYGRLWEALKSFSSVS